MNKRLIVGLCLFAGAHAEIANLAPVTQDLCTPDTKDVKAGVTQAVCNQSAINPAIVQAVADQNVRAQQLSQAAANNDLEKVREIHEQLAPSPGIIEKPAPVQANCPKSGQVLNDYQAVGADAHNRLNLAGCDFASVTFNGAPTFRYVILDGAVFNAQKLDGAVFDHVRLVGTSFVGASINNTKFRYSNLQNILMNTAVLEGVSFADCILAGANMSSSALTNVTFQGYGAMDNIDFDGTSFDNVTFKSDTGMRLQQVNFSDTTGKGLSLSGYVDISRGNFDGAKLSGVSFEGGSSPETNDLGNINATELLFDEDTAISGKTFKNVYIQAAGKDVCDSYESFDQLAKVVQSGRPESGSGDGAVSTTHKPAY